MSYGLATEQKITQVVEACRRYGDHSIVVLWGVAGTGKTLVALAAAQRHSGHPLFVRQIQFHQSYGYEEFIEGLRSTPDGGFEVRDGVFLEWNLAALRDPANPYVLLIEEFTRANITSVLGELMTYIEFRDRAFELPLSRRSTRVATNLAILATMNPRDRSALEVDDALIRRLRIVDCPPDVEQLREMLRQSLIGGGTGPGEQELIEGLARLFKECEARHPETYHEQMPFGHGIFAGVKSTEDLEALWHQRIRYFLRRPLTTPHPFAETLEELYLWKSQPGAPTNAVPNQDTAGPP